MYWLGYVYIGSYGHYSKWNDMAEDGHYYIPEVPDCKPWLEELLENCSRYGMTNIFVSLNNAMVFPSHPELAYKGARTAKWMNDFVKRAKARGVVPIPELNFGNHQACFLNEYARMLSTPTYYKVARDLLKDVYEAFDRPPIINIGMDEETYTHLVITKGNYWSHKEVISWRTRELFYHDANYLGEVITRLGARPMMCSDVSWWHNQKWMEPEAKPYEMFDRISKNMIMENWVYTDFSKVGTDNEHARIKDFKLLEERGYDQIPTCSACYDIRNIRGFLEYMRNNLDPKKLLGIQVDEWSGPSVILRSWAEVARCRAELWPEEEERIRKHFKKFGG